MTRTRLRPRCTAIATDKKQCGKRCHDNESPALCHVHRALANGGTVGTPFVSTKTPMERIEKIAGKDGHPNQMQALKILLEEAKVVATPTERAAEFVYRLTLVQRKRLRELKAEVDAIREAARLQARTWDEVRQCYLDAEETPIPYTPPVHLEAAASTTVDADDLLDGEEEV